MTVFRLNWLEQTFADVKLMPKMVLLMVFSTLLLTGKLFFDANQLRSEVLQQTRGELQQKLAVADGVLKAAFETQSQLGGEASAKQFALDTLNKMRWSNNGHFWVISAQGSSAGVALLYPDQASMVGKKLSGIFDVSSPGNIQTQLSLSSGEGEGGFSAIKQGNEFEVYTRGFKPWGWSVAASVSHEQVNTIYNSAIKRGLLQTLIMVVIFIFILVWAANTMSKQVTHLVSGINRISNKDLRENITLNSKDEFGEIAAAVRLTASNWQALLAEQQLTSDQLNDVSEQLSICMEAVQDSIEEEFGQIDELASAMSQMAATVKEVANNASIASSATTDANKVALDGNRYVEATIGIISSLSSNIDASSTAVNEVESKVGSIGTVVDTIRGISEQTNLLALNAAIEAARAGEQGRGFAVVADEVRNLAQRTQDATVEIQRMIEQLQTSAGQAVGLMKTSVDEAQRSVEQVSQAGEKIDFIAEQVHSIADLNSQIATASEQQSGVAIEMNENLSQVKELVEGSVTVLKELNEVADIIATHAQTMDATIKTFKVN
ncbi:methyl-accepting chemotaxis protein [Motilimonas cestriensis]|uniref:Methyl-accepting chemotaxis protein n=1 Tax=Motilimonas cestriensis TaxID=2742685 RepID=A0ABS8WCI0_9GAMM|nr:methyl-accepting chemotaxis protein [Motilimonas cestriensis]MCE2595973.1 methyl-accepting chemotaxis protein [Motilimonas cestriensis]